jgi:DNA-binding transcriptional LysR family regulator
MGALADSTLIARKVASNERVLVASPDYLRKYKRPLQPADLSAHTCLVCAYPGSLQNVWSLRSGDRRASVAVRGELRSDNGEILRDWFLSGLGISLRETWDVASELHEGSLVRVLPKWETESTSIFAVRAPRSPLPHRIAIFLDFLAERWQRAPWEKKKKR